MPRAACPPFPLTRPPRPTGSSLQPFERRDRRAAPRSNARPRMPSTNTRGSSAAGRHARRLDFLVFYLPYYASPRTLPGLRAPDALAQATARRRAVRRGGPISPRADAVLLSPARQLVWSGLRAPGLGRRLPPLRRYAAARSSRPRLRTGGNGLPPRGCALPADLASVLTARPLVLYRRTAPALPTNGDELLSIDASGGHERVSCPLDRRRSRALAALGNPNAGATRLRSPRPRVHRSRWSPYR